MADGIVASLSGNWTTVTKVVQAIFNGASFTVLAEDCLATKSPRFEPVSSLDDKVRYPRGRAFDRLREVRWREISPGWFVITYLSDTSLPRNASLPAENGFELSREIWHIQKTTQKLYGKWSMNSNDWVEVSVPGVSGKYQSLVAINPLPNSLQIAAFNYIRDGVVQMTRFCAVEPYR